MTKCPAHFEPRSAIFACDAIWSFAATYSSGADLRAGCPSQVITKPAASRVRLHTTEKRNLGKPARHLELLHLGEGGAQGVRLGGGELAEIVVLLLDALLAPHVAAVALVEQQVDRQSDREVRAQGGVASSSHPRISSHAPTRE